MAQPQVYPPPVYHQDHQGLFIRLVQNPIESYQCHHEVKKNKNKQFVELRFPNLKFSFIVASNFSYHAFS
jgi:hypothetical protein